MLIYKIKNKHGPENFAVTVIYPSVRNLRRLNELEIKSIKKFKSNDRRYGYNLTAGGDGGLGNKNALGCKRSLAQRELTSRIMRVAMLGNTHGKTLKGIKRSLATRKRMSLAMMGNQNTKGYKHTAASKRRMKIASRKRVKNPTVLRNMRLGALRRWRDA